MKKHILDGGLVCRREETEHGIVYDPYCPQCQKEQAAERLRARTFDPSSRLLVEY